MSLSGCFLLQLYAEKLKIKNLSSGSLAEALHPRDKYSHESGCHLILRHFQSNNLPSLFSNSAV